MSKLKTIVLTASGLSVCPGFLYAQNTSSHQVGLAIMRLNSSILDQAPKQYFQSGSLWGALRQDFRMSEVNPELVRRHESKFIESRGYFDRIIARSKPYMYHIATEVKKRNMPAEAALLPFIESAFVTKAKSHVGASGLWQFMPATGRHYGLEKTPVYDGRHDVYAATDAALNYLQYLYGLFGDWPLAFSAYNWGEGNVGRAINRARAQGLEPTYENLRMPNETRNYVPKLLAVRNIIANPQSFGISISDIDNKPYFQAIELDHPIDNEAITRLAGITQSELLALNPAFNVPAFIPKSKRKLLLPVGSVQTFQSNYLNSSPDSLFSWETYTPASKTALSDIASATGMSIADIKRLNNLNGNLVNAGRSILVTKNSPALQTAFESVASIDIDNTPDTYRSNMPAEPVNITLSAVQAQPIQAANVAVTPIEPAAPAPKNDSLIVQNQTGIEDTAQVLSQKQTPMPSEVKATEPAQNITQNDVQAEDELMQLIAQNNLRRLAEESVSNVINVPDSVAEHKIFAPSQHIVVANNKRQTRLETRITRAADTDISPLHASIHRVVEGDTLFNIAKRYNVSVADLIVANNIKGNAIQKGQVLRLAQAKPAKTHIDKVSYTIRKGDTFKSISARFNINIDDIHRLNPDLNTISPGQRIKLIGS
ncbi:LysM peptidoglycan-binding domain-containing protein [Neisseria cinerea]|uniref:LysM domain protein n=1 Tax=Neisseria cinerea ATCC 14685 TaxID=546262 RepID=D0W180_NEICI|nr:LysM peptidoglycan-binding domain-containing protein [Neisseria cinerea]EEZ72468.1 LysM domain protein [Neisseria cinerea ATCC 14685]MCD2070642.1 LysM peptidoglycan-binding domain-containing protein [Neisseria cinerea]